MGTARSNRPRSGIDLPNDENTIGISLGSCGDHPAVRLLWNVAANVKKLINIHGKSSSVSINGVHFSGFTVQGRAITSQSDSDASWSLNSYVSNITFE
jgi:hypothetical protein